MLKRDIELNQTYAWERNSRHASGYAPNASPVLVVDKLAPPLDDWSNSLPQVWVRYDKTVAHANRKPFLVPCVDILEQWDIHKANMESRALSMQHSRDRAKLVAKAVRKLKVGSPEIIERNLRFDEPLCLGFSELQLGKLLALSGRLEAEFCAKVEKAVVHPKFYRLQTCAKQIHQSKLDLQLPSLVHHYSYDRTLRLHKGQTITWKMVDIEALQLVQDAGLVAAKPKTPARVSAGSRLAARLALPSDQQQD